MGLKMTNRLIDIDLPSERLDVSFKDITYTVREKVYLQDRKDVLKGVSGEFRAGHLTVIIGPSGAGKSSLMDVIAGYKSASSGTLLLNGRARDERFYRQRACYIMQSDVVQPLLTVREALTVAAELKLGGHVTHAQKKKRVDEIIEVLKLSCADGSRVSAEDTPSGALSGGQRKRLAVGLELVSDPGIMLLDEPTSGLDSSTSKHVISMLRGLANQGRTMIITMHQPSTPLLVMMDRIYAVHSGYCAFMGAVSQLVLFLRELGHDCPPYHNPVDFFIEVIMDKSSNKTPTLLRPLVDATENGKNTRWISPVPDMIEKMKIDSGSMLEPIQLTALPRLQKIAKKFTPSRRYNTSFPKQFSELFLRSIKIIWRDPSLMRSNLLIHCAVSLAVGCLCYNVGEDAKSLSNRTIYNALYFGLLFVFYAAFSSVILRFPCEMPVLRREHFNRWYCTSAYYAATLAASLPTQIVSAVTYSVITYWLTGQPMEFIRFISFTFLVTLTSLVALAIGILVGTIFDVKNAAIWGPFFMMPFTVFSGFFLLSKDAPFYLRWMFKLSFLNHGMVGLCIAIFGWDRPKLATCTEEDYFCRFNWPHEFLQELELDQESYGLVVLWLCLTLLFVTIVAYAILRLRLKYKT